MYQFYQDGFFGYGEKGDFQYGSVWHLLPILVLLAAVVLVAVRRERIAAWKYEGRLRFVLAFAAIMVEMSYFWRLLYVGSGSADSLTLMTKLPIQVCQWGCILAAFMLMSGNRTLFGICYYICLTFTVVPLLTPAVISTTGPAYYRYYQFWGEHCLPIFFVLYMVFVHGYRPRFRDMAKPLLVLVPLMVLSVIANSRIPGANYMYLAGGTEGGSVANLLPQNMGLRLVVYGLVGFALFCLAYLPFWLADLRRKKKGAAV